MTDPSTGALRRATSHEVKGVATVEADAAGAAADAVSHESDERHSPVSSGTATGTGAASKRLTLSSAPGQHAGTAAAQREYATCRPSAPARDAAAADRASEAAASANKTYTMRKDGRE